MTPTLTQQVEQVLQKRIPSLFERDPGGERNWDLIDTIKRELVALLTPTAPPTSSVCPNCGVNPPTYCYQCWERQPTATPSRADLEKILFEHITPSKKGGWETTGQRLREALMAWAAPRPLRKEELEKIVSEFFQATYTMQPHDPKAMYNLSELIAQIWSWLSGPREAKELPSPCPQPSLIQTSLLSLSPDFGVCRCCKKCPSCCQCIGQPRPAG